jgi:hypothetical protein
MGLDMYLKRTNRTDHSIEELQTIDHDTLTPESPEASLFLPLRKYEFLNEIYTIFHEVAYFRKFNALHNWFVSRVQGGVDECQLSEIDEETLIELIDDLRAVSNGETVEDLEPVSGFFFGSTDKDEYYLQRINDALNTFEEILRVFDFKNHRLFYRASW